MAILPNVPDERPTSAAPFIDPALCTCAFYGSSDPETPDIEDDEQCPKHGTHATPPSRPILGDDTDSPAGFQPDPAVPHRYPPDPVAVRAGADRIRRRRRRAGRGAPVLTADHIAALRPLLARIRAAGYRHFIFDGLGDKEHVWRRGETEQQQISLYAGFVSYDADRRDYTVQQWSAPANDIARIAAVLELAGALPPVDQTSLIRTAIADPGQFCAREKAWDDGWEVWVPESIAAWGARAVVLALAGAR